MPTSREDLFGCDTLVAMAAATADRSVIFARNSDRLPDECQHLRAHPSREWAEGATVRCQYQALPQARPTHRVLGSQPFWLWGFEHGVNERGVAAEPAQSRRPGGRSAQDVKARPVKMIGATSVSVPSPAARCEATAPGLPTRGRFCWRVCVP